MATVESTSPSSYEKPQIADYGDLAEITAFRGLPQSEANRLLRLETLGKERDLYLSVQAW